MELLFLGLAITLVIGFEFVNGFHDTANAVATVIYTNTLKPTYAVIWSGIWNLIGVLTSSGSVAFAIIALLPQELVAKAGSQQSLVMVLSLLISAIIWNLGTWYLGLPISSTHTLIGSITGVSLANSWVYFGANSGLKGLENSVPIIEPHWWDSLNLTKIEEVLISLALSPLIGFIGAVIIFLIAKTLLKQEELYAAPAENIPSFWIRTVLILTCTGVSFAHGSNDGQKGIGLMTLILVGFMPSLLSSDALNISNSNAEFTIPFIIPYWIKIIVALALGLGTMVGWKRVVITVGEKIGNEHLNYAQGATAELVTMTTISIADYCGLPVSTTQILASGIAGTMVADRSGIQIDTLRNLLLAWFLTLPVCVLLGFSIYTISSYTLNL